MKEGAAHRDDRPGGRSSGPGSPEARKPGSPVRISLVSLGCSKNLIDSEVLLGSAGSAGIAIAQRPEDADLIVINTCGFIEPARDESLRAIRKACDLKRSSPTPKKVVVVGCLAQKSGEALLEQVPEVYAIVGVGQYDRLAGLFQELAGETDGGPVRSAIIDPDTDCRADLGRLRLTPSHYAYLRISEGCDNPCTFCSIPSIRGRFRSKPLDDVVAEARELAASGARELVLISQDSTSYGVDLDGRFRLPELLERVASVDGVRWVRLLYAYPAFFTEEMIDAVARIPGVVKYIDMPIQHIDERMLRKMGRRMLETDTRRLLDRLRERIPGLYLRTTFLVGFPGETEAEFARLLDFVREFRFERLGVFAYSHEEGTPSARMPGEVPEEVRRQRLEAAMLAQQEVAFAQNRGRIGETCEALVDGRERGRFFARSRGEAPEIDPRIIIVEGSRPRRHAPGGRTGPLPAEGGDSGGFREIPLASQGPPSSIGIGNFIQVKIEGTKGYDLIARHLQS